MTKRKGFTLIELLVVVAIIALLISILLPSLSRARELAKRTVCASNLKEIGTGMYLYAQDGDKFPALFRSNVNGTANQFAYRNIVPPTTGTPSTTADMWILIRQNNATPKLFICPSTADQPDPSQDNLVYFDFLTNLHLSYSYQYQEDTDRPILGSADDPTLPIAADSNPYIKGMVTSGVDLDRASQWRGNSTNHTNREGQNTLYLDSHVDFTKAPDNGPSCISTVAAIAGPKGRDNMYTRHPPTGIQPDPGGTNTFPNPNPGTRSDIVLVP